MPCASSTCCILAIASRNRAACSTASSMATVSSAVSLSHSRYSEGVTGIYMTYVGWLWPCFLLPAMWGCTGFRRSTAWGDDGCSLHGLGRRGVLAPRLEATMGVRSTAWGDNGCSLHGLGRRWLLSTAGETA